MKVWVYLDGRQQGPFEMEELRSLAGFNENTKVWFEGLPKWYPAGSLNEMRPLFETEKPDESSQEPAEGEEEAVEVDTVIVGGDPVEAPKNRLMPGQMFFNQGSKPDEPCPPTYIGWTIFLLICCCSPISVAGLVASLCVSSFYGRGDMDKARKASEVAAWLVMAAIALGFLPVMFMGSFAG